jgi:hypothetical protein
MPNPEHQPGHSSTGGEPLYPAPLSPELADVLRPLDIACVTEASNFGTIFVVKAPLHEIQRMRGQVPVHIKHELYQHPAAPVIRTVVTIFDQPTHPLALETFFNIRDEEQAANLACLALQPDYYFLFYDETLTHRLTKLVPQTEQLAVADILLRAVAISLTIPAEQFDFEQAKAAVMEQTRL